MARERKPLIEPGSVLPSADTLSRILERDRVTSGRKPMNLNDSDGLPQAHTAMPAMEIEAEALGNITSNITAQTVSNADRQTDSRAERKMPARNTVQNSGKPYAQAYAKQLAATRSLPITLRLPEGLNDWLDEYAHAHRKHGVKKQDLVARAVELLVIALSAEEFDAANEN